MSIATEITRLQTAKADLKTAIEAKGVTVGDITIDGYAAKVAEIPQGSGKAHTFELPSISGTYTYTGAVQTAQIVGYYSNFMTKTGDLSATNAGSYSITLTLMDTENCQWSDGTTTPKVLPWSIAKAALPKPAIRPSSFNLDPNITSGTMTVTRSGDGAITATSSDTSVVTASVSGTTVTVTAIDTSTDTSETVTITVAEGTNYLAYTATDVVANVAISSVVPTAYIASVSGLGNEDPSSVVFVRDTGFPTSFEEVTFNGDIFIKIPTMYRKVDAVSDGQITAFTISTTQIDGDYKPYPCFVDENGNTLDYVLIGKYWNTSSNDINSVESTSNSNQTINVGRTRAQARGTGYLLYDWMIHKLWQDLLLLLKQTVDTNTGVAWTYDDIGFYWGSSTSPWIDGMTSYGTEIAVSYEPTKYVNEARKNTTGYTGISYSLPSVNQEIQKLGYDANNPFVNIPSVSVSNSNYNTYYCDATYYSGGSHPRGATIGFPNASAGIFYYGGTGFWDRNSGIRLCYRPISS